MKSLAAIAALLIAATSAAAAEIVLRERAEVSGPVLRLGDVADIAADTPAELDELVTTPLMPTPAPGSAGYLTSAQVMDLLNIRGVDTSNLNIVGAEAVALGNAAVATKAVAARSTVPQPMSFSPKAARGATAVAAEAIADFLRQQTSHSAWNVTVQPDAQVVAALQAPALGKATVGGGRAPYTGSQRFEITTSGGARIPVYARVERISKLVFAVRGIEKGSLVRAVDVEIREFVGEPPRTAASNLEALIGKESVQSIQADQLVLTSQVRLPTMIRRGERIEVTARAQGVAVRTYATAQQEGARGDLIMVESLEGRQRYAARVVGPQKAEIFAATASADDLSSPLR